MVVDSVCGLLVGGALVKAHVMQEQRYRVTSTGDVLTVLRGVDGLEGGVDQLVGGEGQVVYLDCLLTL